MAVSASSPSLCFRTILTRAGNSNLLIPHQPTITGHFSSPSLHLFTKSRSRSRTNTLNPHLIKSIERGKEENTNQPSIELESEPAKTLESSSSSEAESDSVDGLGSEIQEAMKAKKKERENEDKVLGGGGGGGGGGDFWSGVAEEIGKIEWPAFGKVLGTTGVVLGVIAGSSVVLLTVNAVLAELSDRVFVGRGVQDFFG